MFGLSRLRNYLEKLYEECNTPWWRLGIPPCAACKSSIQDFTLVRPFLYSVDRLSRGRVKATLRCNRCSFTAVIMRWGDGSRWSWYESN